ncbi:hypothetical protein BU204_17915 [Actinophytocola xanthii]|uniref:HTH cro/C1-type domain-containing protein n=2 Tax=Actinophytocola xanthii TaxID=1912961 RepID=A0A1Q8CPG0_9PSEU|nr:hypothetical protein BU204_17915 [Actinophytocola xanthii]
MRLRGLRQTRAKLNLEKAAKVTGLSPATLCRIETGKRGVSSEEVAVIATAYRIPSSERKELIEFVKSGDSGGWWERPLPGVPPEMGVLASYAAEADSLTDWAVMLIPGLLQVEPYARALIRSDGVPPEDVDFRWIARQRRQEILGKIDYTAFVYETALHVPFGGPQVHKEQIRHLVGARDRGIGLRILRARPLSLLFHSWHYMTFPGAEPVVNVEVLGGGLYLQDDRVDLYTRRLKLLHDLALSSAESQAMLQALLKEM